MLGPVYGLGFKVYYSGIWVLEFRAKFRMEGRVSSYHFRGMHGDENRDPLP